MSTIDPRSESTIPVVLNPVRLWILAGWTVVFYLLFHFFAPWIHQLGPRTDEGNVNPWLRVAEADKDGLELYFMTVAMPAYMVVAYFLCRWPVTLPSAAKWTGIGVALILLTFILNFFYKEPAIHFQASVAVAVICFGWCRFMLWLSTRPDNFLTSFSLLAGLTAVGLLINTPASIFDFGYLIGPANKMLQGELPGEFYMQYNLLSTSFFALMQSFHIGVEFMFVIFIFIFSCWILLYKKLATQVFNNRSFVFLFIAALIVVRMLGIWEGPVNQPQVSSLRMDLWVPLLLVVWRCGFRSFYTSLAFSLCYLCDDVFGLLYLILYAGSLMLTLLTDSRQNVLASLSRIWLLLLPLACLAAHYAVFQSFSSQSGKIYSDLHIGFLPIAPLSSFWLIAWLLPILLCILSTDRRHIVFHLFVTAIACIQLTYFFGRSHDHNLMNISGIFLFMLFLALDRLYDLSVRRSLVINLCIALVCAMAVNYTDTMRNKYYMAKSILQSRSIAAQPDVRQDLEKQAAWLKSAGYKNIVTISDLDPYINYRLGLRQTGFFSPFGANVYTDSTILFLKRCSESGMSLVLFPPARINLGADLQSFNDHPLMRRDSLYLLPLEHGMAEIRFMRRSAALLVGGEKN